MNNKEYQRKWYLKNKDIHKVRVLKSNYNTRKTNRELLIKYLELNHCVDCKEKDIRVLQFDHLSNKRAMVSDMVKNAYSWKTILEEISKCEVVCANCHVKRTNKRGGFYRQIFSDKSNGATLAL